MSLKKQHNNVTRKKDKRKESSREIYRKRKKRETMKWVQLESP
jgi:hypothetical protein